MPMIMMRTIYNNYCQWNCWRQSWWCSWWWWVDELNVTFEGNHDEQPPHRLCSHKVGSGRQHQSWMINCISNWNLLLCACCCLDYNSVNSIVQFLCSPFQMISCVTKLWSGQCPVQFTQVGHLGQVGPKPRKDLKKHKLSPEYSSNSPNTQFSKLGHFKIHRTWFTNSQKSHTLPLLFFHRIIRFFWERKSSEK